MCLGCPWVCQCVPDIGGDSVPHLSLPLFKDSGSLASFQLLLPSCGRVSQGPERVFTPHRVPREALTPQRGSCFSEAPPGQSPTRDHAWAVWGIAPHAAGTPAASRHPNLCSTSDFLRSILYPAQSDLRLLHLMKLHRCRCSASLQDSKRQ